MTPNEDRDDCWGEYLSPFKLTLLAASGVSFGGLLVLLTLGSASLPLVVLTISTGVSFLTLVMGAIIASRRVVGKKESP